MHELSLAQSLVNVLEEQAKVSRYHKVKQIWLEMSALTCVEEHALRFGLEFATRGTLAEGVEIHIAIHPAPAICLECHQTIYVMEYGQVCQHCHSQRIHITPDSGVKIKELEVE